MRQGSTRIIQAFLDRKAKRLKNDSTDGQRLLYHGNVIAWWGDDGSLSLTLAGYGTVTTRLRLNTICDLLGHGRPYSQRKGEQYFDGQRTYTDSTITFYPLADDIPLAA